MGLGEASKTEGNKARASNFGLDYSVIWDIVADLAECFLCYLQKEMLIGRRNC